jgi:hypothetical protein
MEMSDYYSCWRLPTADLGRPSLISIAFATLNNSGAPAPERDQSTVTLLGRIATGQGAAAISAAFAGNAGER